MTIQNDGSDSDRLAKSAFWASAAFYALVAFEFFYMASPFAAYFYAIYGPGLDVLGDSPTASWLISFFLPHIIAQTTSPFVDAHNIAGVILMALGLLGFAVGAVQIYSAKLLRKEAVEGGIYRWIRHPQYLALMVAGFGMLLLWPRFLVLFGFVTVLFVYVLLARIEERLCLRQFSGYADYMQRTGMFLPRLLETPFRTIRLLQSLFARCIAWLLAYIATLVLTVLIGLSIKSHAVNSLYAHDTQNAVYVSVGRLEKNEIKEISSIATADPIVKIALQKAGGPDARFINYLLPTELLISEIPMHIPKGARTGHSFPEDHDRNFYKIVFTLAEFGAGNTPESRDILLEALNKRPVIEVWVDRKLATVTQRYDPPKKAFYNDMPVPVF